MTAPRTLRTPAALIEAGLAAPERLAELEAVAARYAVAVTRPMSDLIEGGCEGIARQFVPEGAELETRAEEMADPIGDHTHSPVEGLVHRYRDRVLLKLTPVCAVYCRFCFRREMVGPSHESLTEEALDAALAYISGHSEVWEVVLSGGDPLILSPRRLTAVMHRLAAMDHVKVVRFHTRVPAVSPERVTEDLVAALKCEGKAVFVALHANHPDELTAAARAACARIVDAGIPMLGQTVLLKGVNDDPDVLTRLMRAMVESRIKPYYLHHADLAPGTAAFRTTLQEGQNLMRALRAQASGLCQPTYVLDIPGGYGKVPVGPGYVEGDVVESPTGVRRPYP